MNPKPKKMQKESEDLKEKSSTNDIQIGDYLTPKYPLTIENHDNKPDIYLTEDDRLKIDMVIHIGVCCKVAGETITFRFSEIDKHFFIQKQPQL